MIMTWVHSMDIISSVAELTKKMTDDKNNSC